MAKNLTQGNSLVLILLFSIPLLLGNIFQQFYNVVDAALVGRFLGSNFLAAVGCTTSVQFLILGFCMGSCAGFAIPVATAFGAGDYKRVRSSLFSAYLITAVFAVFMTVFCIIFTPLILNLLKVPSDIYPMAKTYLLIIFAGIPFSFLYNLLSGVLRAVGDSVFPFIFLFISTFLNIVLDVVFIVVLKMGVGGAAFATVFSQAISGILCLIHIARREYTLKLTAEDLKINYAEIKNVLGMGVPMGLQYSITAIGSMIMQSANNGLGTVYVSSFTAGTKIRQFTMGPFDSLATAVSTFASQNLGAGKFDRIKKGIFQGVFMGVLYGTAIGLCFIFFGKNLVQIFISPEDKFVYETTIHFLKCVGLFMWILGILNVVRMSVQGLGYSRFALFAGVLEMIARTGAALIFVPIYKFETICFADQSAWMMATIYIVPVCIVCYRKLRKNYLNKQDEC